MLKVVFIYLKKCPPVLIVIFLLPAILPLTRHSFFAAHDAVWHVARFYQFHLSLVSGQFPVRWAPTLFYGLGYPAFVANFQFPYYLMEVIYRFGFNLVDTYKIVLGLSIVGSFVFCYLFLSKIYGRFAAIVGSAVYSYSPYHFATLYARGALGEAAAGAFVPFAFWAVTLWADQNIYGGLLIALSVFLLITAHPSMFLIFAPFLLLYLALLSKKLKHFTFGLLWIILGFIASSFQTLPSIFETKFMMFEDVYKNVYLAHFPNLHSVFRIPGGGADLGTPFQVGIVNWLVLGWAIMIFLRSKKEFNIRGKTLALAILAFGIGVLMMTRQSSFMWQHVPFVYDIVFPWRFLNLLVFACAIGAGFLLNRLSFKLIFGSLLVILVIFASRHYFGWVGQIPADDNYYKSYQETTTAGGEFTPKNTSPIIRYYAQPPIEVIDGDARIADESLKPNSWQFSAEGQKDSLVKLAILNFPGWRVSVDKKAVEIIGDYQSREKDLRGLILIKIKKGRHDIQASFGETKIRRIADFLSLSVLVFLALEFVRIKFRQKEN